MKNAPILLSTLSLVLLGSFALAKPPLSPSPAPSPAGGEQKIPPPGELLKRRAPDFSRWTISTTVGKKGKDKEPGLQIIVEKTGPVTEVRRIEAKGGEWQIWHVADLQVAIWPDGKQVGLVAKPTTPELNNPLYKDFSRSDFHELDWVAKDNYQGVEELDGRPCLVFATLLSATGDTLPSRDASGKPNPDSEAAEALPVRAWIDYYSHLPVQFDQGGQLMSYAFGMPGVAVQTLPPAAQALIDTTREQAGEVEKKPSRPF